MSSVPESQPAQSVATGSKSPANPMSYDEVADKFRGCAEFAEWDKGKTEQIIETVWTLEQLKSVRELTSLLAR